MRKVNVGLRVENNSHDVSLDDGQTVIGLRYKNDVVQAIPINDPARAFSVKKDTWFGGRGKLKYQDDPNGYFDAHGMWTLGEKLYPGLLPKYATGYRDQEMRQPGSVAFKPLIGATTYLASSFVASASSNRSNVYVWLRIVGKPGPITIAIYSSSAGSPNASQGSVEGHRPTSTTKKLASGNVNIYGPTVVSLTPLAVTSGTTYWVVVSHAGTAANHWEVGCDGTDGKKSTDGSTWSTYTYSPYYRVTDAPTNRLWYMFSMYAADYFISNEASPLLYINGDRGKCTSTGTTTLTDSKAGTGTWTTDEWAGAKVKIINGTGDGSVATIASNNATALTISPAITTGTTSEYVIFDTDVMKPITGHGFSAPTCRPYSIDQIAIITAHGHPLRQMAIDYTQTNNHKFGDGTSTNLSVSTLYASTAAGGRQIWGGVTQSAALLRAAVPTPMTFGTTALTFTTPATTAGGTDTRIRGMYGADAVYIFKDDALYKIVNNMAVQLITGLENYPSVYNGLAALFVNRELWFGWAHSVVRMVAGSFQDMLNLRGSTVGVPEDRTGPFVSATSLGKLYFFAINGLRVNRSSVIVWNGKGWSEVYRSPSPTSQIRNVFVQSMPESRSKLWIDDNGDLVYMKLPLYSDDPEQDTSLDHTYFAELITSTFDGGDVSLSKAIHSIKVVTEQTRTQSTTTGTVKYGGVTGTVDIAYQINDEVGLETWRPAGLVGLPYRELPIGRGDIKQWRLRIRIYSTSSTYVPKLVGLEMPGMVFTPAKYQWVSTYVVDDLKAVDKQSDPDIPADTVFAFLKDANTKGKVLTMHTAEAETDGKKVMCSAPAKVTNKRRYIDGKWAWKGEISVVLREVG